MGKHLVYSNTGLSSKQIGLTAEYIEVCRQKGLELKVVLCDNILDNCYFNPLHNSIACASCQSRTLKLLKQIGISDSDIIRLKEYQSDINIPFFNDLNDLLSYKYKGINVGRGVASSIISYYRDYHISSHTHKDIIELELTKSVKVLLNFEEIIKSINPEKVVLFNGRFSEIYPLLDFCTQNKLDYVSIESGARDTYELFENSLPHSIIYRHQSMIRLWDEENDIEKKKRIAHDWYKKKRKRDDSIEISFTKKQELNSLPENFNPDKRNILILNSSEDEMKVIEEFQTDLFDTQNEAIERIVSEFESNSNFHFYLRIHPNLGRVSNVQIKEIDGMRYDNLTIIGPNDEIDTYAMLDNCEKSIVFGSTTGIEATYWGKTSILLGKSFYYYLEDTCYKPNSYEELFTLIEEKKLPSKSQEACLPYGYYFSTYGIEARNFKFDGLTNSYFKDKRIKKWYFSSIWLGIKYFLTNKKWVTAYKAATQEKFRLKDLLRYKI